MNKFKLTVFFLFLLTIHYSLLSYSQDSLKKGYKLPAVNIKTLKGKSFNTADIDNKGNPVILSFWATWCKPCIKEMTAINELYDDWKKQTGVKLIAVSIDDTRTKTNVLPLINGKSWDFEFMTDENSDFKRAMNVSSVPHMFILNKKNEVVWQHNSFNEGDEKEIFQILKKL